MTGRPDNAPLLQARRLCKSYGPVRVLAEVDFELRAGEVHALVGENGAGKSTLSRILAGLTEPDSGSMALAGATHAPRDRRQAERAGVRMVMQELNLVGNLTVAESLFLDRLPHRWGWIDQTQLRQRARAALSRVGLADLEPERLISSLGVGQQQLVEIAAGLCRDCRVLILDEPTAALTDVETEQLFRQISVLREAGAGILYISHRLEEIRRIADRLSVLRDGRLVATRPAGTVAMEEIVRLMVGRDLGAAPPRARRKAGNLALEVHGFRRLPAVQDVSFDLRRGEILGLAGLMGSGRTETVRAVFGADAAEAGEIRLHGKLLPTRFASPREAVRHGIALLTENRKEQGLLLPLAVRTNVTLPSIGRLAGGAGWLRQTAETIAAANWVQALGVRCRDIEQPVADLSGGNQQKVVIAKWLLRDCDILMFDEPTRGIDVGARFEIYEWLDRLAAQGKAVLVVSSDLPELMGLCDRIVVMSAGRVAGRFDRGDWSQDRIMNAALSGYVARAA